MKKTTVLVVAAGEGKRFGSLKQFALLAGRPVLDWSLEKFEANKKVDEIILVLPDESQKEKYLKRYQKIVAVTKGGEKRQDSVLSGFNLIGPMEADIVLVHDGARPLVSEELISRVIQATLERGAVVPVLPLEDTVKEVAKGIVLRTLDRSKLFRVQTPQGFSYSVLREALEAARRENFCGTDEAMLVERMGEKIHTIEGDPKNIKITTQEEMKIAEALIEI
jgi:2-C-methyl-D-erythritol 4-phosphate cytidylyltransferase